MKSKILGLHALAAAALSLSSATFAADVIDACVKFSNPNKGGLRIIEDGGTCSSNEKPLKLLSGEVPPSLICPAGTTMFTGVCIENASRTPKSHSDAEDTCAAEMRRLPSGGELSGFRTLPGIQISSSGEWTDDLGDIATSSTFKYFAVTQTGNGVVGAFDSLAFRCVVGPEVE